MQVYVTVAFDVDGVEDEDLAQALADTAAKMYLNLVSCSEAGVSVLEDVKVSMDGTEYKVQLGYPLGEGWRHETP